MNTAIFVRATGVTIFSVLAIQVLLRASDVVNVSILMAFITLVITIELFARAVVSELSKANIYKVITLTCVGLLCAISLLAAYAGNGVTAKWLCFVSIIILHVHIVNTLSALSNKGEV